MIPLLLFFLTINFQSDFKGFSSKDEALYYSELLKCEGYFTKNDNEKYFTFHVLLSLNYRVLTKK